METIERVYDVRKMKNDIKSMAEMQKFYKNQRKTVHKNCSRKEGDPTDISPSEATWQHALNRQKLRVLYSTYLQARGKEISSGDRLIFGEEWMKDDFLTKVKNTLEQYKFKEVVETDDTME